MVSEYVACEMIQLQLVLPDRLQAMSPWGMWVGSDSSSKELLKFTRLVQQPPVD
jgi:hypothetical protein